MGTFLSKGRNNGDIPTILQPGYMDDDDASMHHFQGKRFGPHHIMTGGDIDDLDEVDNIALTAVCLQCQSTFFV